MILCCASRDFPRLFGYRRQDLRNRGHSESSFIDSHQRRVVSESIACFNARWRALPKIKVIGRILEVTEVQSSTKFKGILDRSLYVWSDWSREYSQGPEL
jgi:hypothetical protein